MKYYGKAEQTAQKILDAFRAGNIPEALAQSYYSGLGRPMANWSRNNRIIAAIYGTRDARGFRAWQNAGRKVKKGAKAFYILAPCTVKTGEKDEEGKEKRRIIGVRGCPVFRIEDTEITDVAIWEREAATLIAAEQEAERLPLAPVARAWGLAVEVAEQTRDACLGYYAPGRGIVVATRNLSTWAHELVHAADDRRGTLTHAKGQQPDNEIVAELGGAVLLSMLGHRYDADLGGCWEYISHYSGEPITAATGLLKRVCAAVDLIMDEARRLSLVEAAA